MSDNNVRKVAINTNINGQEMDILVDPYVSLLETLREVVGMTGTKDKLEDKNISIKLVWKFWWREPKNTGFILSKCKKKIWTRNQ